MKKVLVGFGGLLVALGVAALVFWLGWMRAPDGAEVCANVVKLQMQDPAAPLNPKLEAKALEECERRTHPPEYGRMPWVKQMKCMRDATSKDDLKACGR